MKKLKIIFTAILFSVAFLPVMAQTGSTTDEGVEINGLIWATRNVNTPGTFVDNPEDAGMFYQWNRPTGWSSTDPMVNHLGGTTWNESEPAWNTTWVNNVCPTGWRVPDLYTDFNTLTYTTHYGGDLNGVYGFFYENSNGQTLFFPAAGYRGRNSNDEGVLLFAGTEGYYWSSTSLRYTDPYYGSNQAMIWFFQNGSTYISNRNLTTAYSVRCVKDAATNSITDTETTAQRTAVAFYSIMGIKLNAEPKTGMYIVLYDNGTSKKIMVQ